MTKLTLLGIVAIMSAAIATPVLAQQAIQEPGSYAFYHPDSSLGLESLGASAHAMMFEAIGHTGVSMRAHHRGRGHHY